VISVSCPAEQLNFALSHFPTRLICDGGEVKGHQMGKAWSGSWNKASIESLSHCQSCKEESSQNGKSKGKTLYV